jgi:hypothetical protein
MFKKFSIGVAMAVAAAAVVSLPRTAQTAGPVTGLASCHTVTEVNKASGTVAECPAGEVVTGGGGACYGFGGNWESWMTKSAPSGKGWTATCENIKDGKKQTVGEIYAICCKP